MDPVSNTGLENMNGKKRPARLSEHQCSEYVPGRGFERYNSSLKNLLPIRRTKNGMKTMPIDNAGFFSFISFTWISKYMYKAYSKGITAEDLPAVSPYDTCSYNGDRLELLWEDELARVGPDRASFTKVAWRFCRTRIFCSTIIYITSLILGLLVPTLLMRKLLEYIQSGNGSYWEGMKWVVLLTGVEFLRTLFLGWTRSLNDRTGVRLRSACIMVLYRKIIRVNNLGNKSIGEVVNLFANDAQRIADMLLHGPTIIGAPILTAWGVVYILWLFSPMALMGLLTFLLYYIVQYKISTLTRYLRSKTVKISDTRIRLMNEILDCIKLIKMYAWEKRFSQDLLGLRKKEQQVLVKTSYCQNFSVCMGGIIPVISLTVTFLGHVWGGNNLTAAQAFPLSAFFSSQIRMALVQVREGSQSIVDSMVAFRRIKSILLLEDGNYCVPKPIIKSQAVAISHATFSCITFGYQDEGSSPANGNKRKQKGKSLGDKSENEKLAPTNGAKYVDILFDVSFEATKGKLVGICGHVGSGKSNLLLAALGQLRLSDGQVARDGTCAYVSQLAWITNATLRENILFGTGFDRTRYNKAIYACNLDQDIDTMPGGDQTEIGEKGVNLSGGQKQRVALARALYADRDIYFLDDPLSAVDARVGSFIFENLILGALAGKTILFVTHQLHYLNRCDEIYMMQDGRIIENGTHDELMKLGNEYASMVTAVSVDSETNNSKLEEEGNKALKANVPLQEGSPSPTADVSPHIETNGGKKCDARETQLTVPDMLQHGTVKAHTYRAYMVSMGGYFVSFIVILTFLITTGSTAFSSWWLAVWINAGGGTTIIVQNDNETIYSDNINDNPDFWFYQAVYAGTIGIILLASLLRTVVFTKATIGASTKLHNRLFKKIIQSPMRFFDTTPMGRIQHLFSRDMDEVDNRLPGTLSLMAQNTFNILFAVLSICLVFPWFILPICIFGAVYYFMSRIFRVGIRDLKRLENKSRGPVISLVTTTVQGLNTIHAFGKEADFIYRFKSMFDENSKYTFMHLIGGRWLTTRVDIISLAIIGSTAFLVLSLQDHVTSALAGLALAYAIHISSVFQHTIRVLSDIEVRFISVETINRYLKTLKSEGDERPQTIEPPPSWPVAPKIKFSNVRMAYGDGAPIILKGISLSIEAGERIGIVGRTGSGKSSLAVALFRLAELADGKIEIDDVDISEISLHALRTKLSSIPQDPILFSGSIRSNLDPFKLRTDAEIWQALEKTELKSRVESITGGLDASVGFGGDNLSVGERQLLCLTRALLRDSKILVLDEATASVDPETEILVQKAIQQEFPGCTILTIAHRLQTVLSLDRILVMNGGEVLEFDTPSNLLANQSSEFSKMLAAAEQAENQ